MFIIMKKGSSLREADTISTHEMRFEFQRVLDAARSGRPLTVTYRNRPLARIVPMCAAAKPMADDPIFRLHDLAEPMGPMTNTEMDEAIYGR